MFKEFIESILLRFLRKSLSFSSRLGIDFATDKRQNTVGGWFLVSNIQTELLLILWSIILIE